MADFEPPARFLAPGRTQIPIVQPGEYIIWHEHRTVYQGRSFDVPAAMPDGARYRVEAPDGRALEIDAYGRMSSEDPGSKSVSVARFEAPLAGTYRVTVDGGFEPRVIAVGPNRVWPIFRQVALVLGVLALSVGAAIAVGLYGFLRTVPPASAVASGPAEDSLRKLVVLVYGLQAASLVVGLTVIAGVIVNYLRRPQAAGTWLESHFTWQIRTFWWSLFWGIVGLASAVLVIGFFILFGAAVWFVYRVVKGWTELNEGRPMYS